MAYARQPGYSAAQTTQYEHQPTSYTSLQQPYSAEYDYAPADQGTDFDRRDRSGSPKQYPNAYGSNGGPQGHDRDRGQEANWSGYGDSGHNGGREQNGGGRPPLQQPRQRHVAAERINSDPRTRGQPRSKSRPAELKRHPGDVSQQQPDIYRDSQEYQQQYEPEPISHNCTSALANRGYEHNDPSYSRERDRQYRAQVDPTQDYHQHQKDSGYQGLGYADAYDKQPQDNHAFAPVIAKPKYQEPPRSSHGQPPSILYKSETSQWSKASAKRILGTPISPDTVAWDNPFPSFPVRAKKGIHSSSRSLDGSAAEASLKDEQHHEKNYDSRPQTASSKSSSYTNPQPQSIDEHTSNPQNYHNGYFNRRAGSRGEAGLDVTQERRGTRENGNIGARVDLLKPLTVDGRHSEDNRARPSIPVDSAPNSGYERSRTMPRAVSEDVVKPSNGPRPPVQINWQEPGPVAGYYGPEDRGFTPTSPVNTSQRRPYDLPRGESNQKRPYGHAAIQNAAAQDWDQNRDGRQLHNPQDSLGDVFDDYYDTPPPQDHQPYANTGQSQYRSHVDEDKPKFKHATPDFGLAQRCGPTLDKHLQPEQKGQECAPTPVPPHADSRRNPQGDTYAKGQVPRSRSQPNLKDQRSPIQQQDDGFDFGVPSPSARPPATAPARGEYDPNARDTTRFPNSVLRPMNREQHSSERGYPGPMPAAGHRNGDRLFPPARTGQPPAAYHASGGPDRYRSLPQDGGMYGPPLKAYQDTSQPDRYRSPPFRDGQHRPGSAGPPHRPPPNDQNMGNIPVPFFYQDDKHSPQLQEGRSRDGQMRPSGSRPPAINPAGASPPPIKSPVNPDALPSHPAPVRAGLMEGSPVNQNHKPAPVRQYSAVPSPMQLSEPSQKLETSRRPESKQESVPVTYEELDRLKQATARNPNDLAAQLVLAKKTLEAASVLVDERANPRTSSKSREKYIMDAHRIVKKLSGNGYIEATFYLADCYTRGALGLESDTREAFKLYQTAAKAGHAQAAYRVAVCCEIGQEEGGGTSRDAVKAMQWYKRAATLGDTPAMYKMGIISLKGLLGQPRNPREAIVWLKRAAEQADTENPHALHELALLHEKPSGNDGVPKDEAYSSRLFIQAANLGYKFSQYRLGSAYEYGLMGCPVDPRQSIAWYSKAAVQEEHQSELALSGWYLTGSEGILQQSDTEAYLWARKAALAGLAKAEYAMGYFTEVGIGAPANLEDAKRWYWKAASQNFSKARDRLEDLRKGGPTKRKERVSRSNMRKSSEGECIVM